MKKHLIIFKTLFCVFIYAAATAQTLPLLPNPDYNMAHNATVTGKVTVSGSTETPAGIIAILSRVVASTPASYVPVSYSLTNTSGEFSLTAPAGVTYRVTYQYPTAGYTVSSGGTSANFVAAVGNNTLSGSLVLAKRANIITKCNVSAMDPTNWTGTKC